MSTTYTRRDLRRFLADRWDLEDDDPAITITLQHMDVWVGRGGGAAIYENADLGHPDLGQIQIVSFGSAEAQIETEEPPEWMPDIGTAINWRYTLVGTYRGGSDRLYGLPGDEDLYLDFDMAVDHAIDMTYGTDARVVEIEEWTVHPPQHHLPDAGRIVEWAIEWAADCGEVTEGWGEGFVLDDAVIAAADALRDAIAGKIGFRMADRCVARHTVTFTLDKHDIPHWTYTTTLVDTT